MDKAGLEARRFPQGKALGNLHAHERNGTVPLPGGPQGLQAGVQQRAQQHGQISLRQGAGQAGGLEDRSVFQPQQTAEGCFMAALLFVVLPVQRRGGKKVSGQLFPELAFGFPSTGGRGGRIGDNHSFRLLA